MELPQNCQKDETIKTGIEKNLISEIIKESVSLPKSFNVNKNFTLDPP